MNLSTLLKDRATGAKGGASLAYALAALLVAPLAVGGHQEPFADIKVHKQSGIQYVSGGKDEAERKEMQRIANKYPMQLMFTQEGKSEGVSGVQVTVKDMKGEHVIEAVSEGPFFYFNPPSGRWTMDATVDGETVTRTVDLIGRRYIVLEFHFKGAGAQ
jgi:hypothetical protein